MCSKISNLVYYHIRSLTYQQSYTKYNNNDINVSWMYSASFSSPIYITRMQHMHWWATDIEEKFICVYTHNPPLEFHERDVLGVYQRGGSGCVQVKQRDQQTTNIMIRILIHAPLGFSTFADGTLYAAA